MEPRITETLEGKMLYHADGSLWGKGVSVEDSEDIYWEWFRKDGSKLRSGHLRGEKQVGEWVTYDKKGEVYKITQKGL